MSLLLDALKKAALEKQRREQTSSSTTENTTSDAHAEKNREETSHEIANTNEDIFTPHSDVDVGEMDLHLLDEEESNTTLTAETPEESLSLEIAEDEDAKASHAADEVDIEFDIDETETEYIEPDTSTSESEYIQPQAIPASGSVNTITNSNRVEPVLSNDSVDLAPPIQHSPTENFQKEDSSRENTTENKAPHNTGKNAEAKTSTFQEPAKIVEPFHPAAGKVAMAQLLSRSKKVATHARKRMLIMYLLLAITAVIILALYYYFLFSSNSSLGQPTTLRHTPAPLTSTDETVAESAAPDATNTGVADNGTIEGTVDTTSGDKTEPAKNTNAQQPEKNSGQNSSANPPIKSTPAVAVTNQFKKAGGETGTSTAAKQNITTPSVTRINPINTLIERGYQAYQAGDLSTADAAYREALAQDKYDRDALLGAAAVAVRQGRQQDALTLYQQRLTREPRDEYAQAGIVALSSGTESNPQLESELNRLLHEYPNAPYLYFLKGALYAKQKQWMAAQAALFEAWQRDNKNSDLAYNLAVALDHLNQPKEAARFYHQALELTNNHPAFSVESIQRRLQELETTK